MLQDTSEVSGGKMGLITHLVNHNLIKRVFFVCLRKVGVCAEEILVKTGSKSLSTEILELLSLACLCYIYLSIHSDGETERLSLNLNVHF